MSKPLTVAQLRAVVKLHLLEDGTQSRDLDGLDLQGQAFQTGVRVGRESALHYVEHLLDGDYDEEWATAHAAELGAQD